jgi:hypothetical protein
MQSQVWYDPQVPISNPILNTTSFTKRLSEISMFFEGTDAVHQTMKKVAAALDAAGVKYAIVGGMAVNAHRHSRTTKDVDFLVSANGLVEIRKMISAGTFASSPGRPRRFIDPQNKISFDVLVTGAFPGSGEPGPISYPDPAVVSENIDGLAVINLPMLIQLKLAAGRYQDFADVVNLIRENQLSESFADQLHEKVRADFHECLEEMKREDEYERRQGEDPR